MLGKLIKYEFNATSKIYSILILICVAFTAFSCGTTIIVGGIAESNPVLAMLASLPATFLGSIVLSVMTAFPLYHGAWRFYKNLSSDEGYLMHMLPVPTSSLVLSKSIVALVWLLLCTVVGFGSYMASQSAYAYVMINETMESISISEIIPALTELFGIVFDFEANVVFILIMIVIIVLLGTVFSLLSLYLCIAIGQLWTAHRILGAIIAYMGMNLVLNIAVTVAMIVFILISIQSLVALNVSLIICAILMAAAVAACYYATVRIFKTKLNLQ